MTIGNASAKWHNSFLGHAKQKFTDDGCVGADSKPDSCNSGQNEPVCPIAAISLFVTNIFQFRLLIAVKKCICYL
jgi:hypothetical protein